MNVFSNKYFISFIIRRFFLLIPILFGVTLLTYGLMFLSPSDPVEMMLTAQGVPVSPEVIQSMRGNLGLDQPFIVQYASWLIKFLQGDMGTSFVNGKSVSSIMVQALPKTMLLAVSSMAATVLFSIPLGIITAVRQNKMTDYIIRFISFIGSSTPNFLLSFILIYIVALKFNMLPVLASNSIKGLILPTVALAVPMTGKYIRQVRAAILEQLGQDYVRGLLSRGIRPVFVVSRDVLKNALTTIITLLSLSMGSLLGGTAVIERIFVWQGMGFVAIDSIMKRDYPVIQAYVVWMTIIFILINIITDILIYFIDPRIRSGLGEKGRRKLNI